MNEYENYLMYGSVSARSMWDVIPPINNESPMTPSLEESIKEILGKHEPVLYQGLISKELANLLRTTLDQVGRELRREFDFLDSDFDAGEVNSLIAKNVVTQVISNAKGQHD